MKSNPVRVPHRLADIGWLAALAALPLLKHFGVATGAAAFSEGDHTWINLPLRALSRAALRSGEIPLWNKSLSCGTPLLAQGEAGVFYPGNLLVYALPDIVRAYGWTILLHHVLIGWMTYALLRTHRVRPHVGFLFSVLSLLSPYAILNMPTSNFFQTFWLVPGIFLCLALAQSGRPGRAGLLGGLLVGLNLTAGRPELLVYGWMTAALVGATGAALATDRGAALRRVAVFLVVSGVTGLSLGAVQLLPTLEFLPHSSRGVGEGGELSAYGAWLRPARLYALFLFPCFPIRSGLHTAYFSGVPYVGLAPLALVLAAIGDAMRKTVARAVNAGTLRSRRDVVSLAAGAGLALVLATGPSLPLLRALWAFPPLSLLRYPGRALPVFICLFYVLAALAWEGWLRTRGSSLRSVVLALAVVAVGVVGFTVHAGETAAPMIPAVNLGLQLVPLVAVFAWPRLRSRSAWREGSVAAACLIQAIPLFVFYDNPTLPRAEFDRAFAPLATVANAPEDDRRTVVMGFRRSGPARVLNPPSLGNAGVLAGADIVDEYNQFALGTWRAFLEKTVHRQATRVAPFPPEAAVCDLVGIRWLFLDSETWISDPEWEPVESPEGAASGTRLWRRRSNVHRASLVRDLVRSAPLDGASLAERVLRDPPDFRRQVLITDPSAPSLPLTGESSGEISEWPAGTNAFRFTVRSAGPAYLLLRDQEVPGWTAYLDGRPVPHFRADGLFKAVPVPEGEHEVLFRYNPFSFRLGARLSMLAGLAMASAALVIGVRARRGA